MLRKQNKEKLLEGLVKHLKNKKALSKFEFSNHKRVLEEITEKAKEKEDPNINNNTKKIRRRRRKKTEIIKDGSHIDKDIAFYFDADLEELKSNIKSNTKDNKSKSILKSKKKKIFLKILKKILLLLLLMIIINYQNMKT